MNQSLGTAEVSPRAADLCRKLNLRPAATSLLTPEQTPEEFLDLLTGRGLYPDAVRFLARLLPPRDAVWWACLGVRHTASDPLPHDEQEALRVAVRWVITPTDELVKAARDAAAAVPRTPAGSAAHAAAVAAGKSAGRICKLAGAAVLLAASRRPPRQARQTYRELLTIGRTVQQQTPHWDVRSFPGSG